MLLFVAVNAISCLETRDNTLRVVMYVWINVIVEMYVGLGLLLTTIISTDTENQGPFEPQCSQVKIGILEKKGMIS